MALSSTKIDKRVLRQLMADHALRAPDVAKVLRIKPQTVRLYMCGRRGMTLPQLERVKKHFGGRNHGSPAQSRY
jgi:antitoxin component HigA of HigAB toxin-antitoxin module